MVGSTGKSGIPSLTTSLAKNSPLNLAAPLDGAEISIGLYTPAFPTGKIYASFPIFSKGPSTNALSLTLETIELSLA